MCHSHRWKHLLELIKLKSNQTDGLMGPFYARNVNSAVLQIYLSGWKRKNVVKLVPHQQIFVWVHYVVATVASSNLVWWEMPFATHLRLHLKLQRAETENRGTGTGDEVRE